MYKQGALIVIAALFASSLALSISTTTVSAMTAPTVTLSPTSTRENAAILFTLTIKNNDEDDNIENILIVAPKGSPVLLAGKDENRFDNEAWNTFWGPIGGENVAENIDNIADNLLKAAENLAYVSAAFRNAATCITNAGNLLISAANYLENYVAKKLNEAKSIAEQDNIDTAGVSLGIAANYLSKAGLALTTQPVDLLEAAENLVLFAIWENNAGDNLILTPTYATPQGILALQSAGEGLDNSAARIGSAKRNPKAEGTTVENLRGGSIFGASGYWGLNNVGPYTPTPGDNRDNTLGLDNAGFWIENAGKSLGTIGDNERGATLIKEAANYLENYVGRYIRLAAENLYLAGENLRKAGENLNNIGENLLRYTVRLMTTDPKDAAPTENFFLLPHVVENIKDAGDNALMTRDGKLGVFENVIRAGENLKKAADNQYVWLGPELASDIIGKTGEALTNTFRYYLGKVADNLRDDNYLDLNTAADMIDSARGRLAAAGNKLKSTKASLLPASGWALSVPASDPNRVLLSAENSALQISPGEEVTFKFLWRAPDLSNIENDYTISIRCSPPAGSPEEGAMVSTNVTVHVDGRPPYLVYAVVTQENVSENNVVGKVYGVTPGDVTVTIKSSEALGSLGADNKVYVENRTAGVSLVPAVTMTSADNGMTWTGTFNVGAALENWENAWVRVAAPWATDASGLDNTDNVIDNFIIDITKPVFVDNGLDTTLNNLRTVMQPGSTVTYSVTSQKTWTLLVDAQDNRTRIDTSDLDIKRGRTTVTIDSQTNSGSPDNKYFSVILNEGSNTVTVRAVDSVGNAIENKIENVFVDNTKPTVTFSKITRRDASGNQYQVDFENGIVTNDNRPYIKLFIADPGYPNTGWGVPYENRRVILDNDDNASNGNLSVGENNLENLGTWDNGKVGTFENYSSRTAATGLREGIYYIHVVVSDNLHDNENTVFRFIVDVTEPSSPGQIGGEMANVVGKTSTMPYMTKKSSLTMSGTAEPNATIKVELTTDVGVTWTEQENARTTASAAGFWSTEVTFTQGAVTGVRVTAVDSGGNASEPTIVGYAVYDGTPPTVTIDALPATTDKASIMVTGKVTKDTWEEYADLTVTIRIGSGSAFSLDVDETGAFSTSATLVEGLNSITVKAVDATGNDSSDTVNIERVVTPLATYAIIIVIVALILAAIAIFRKK